MKYRTAELSDEIIVVTEDGGVACIREVHGDGYETVIDYYQSRIDEDMFHRGDDPWEELGEGKMYCDESELPYTDPEHIQTCLAWLVVGETEFEIDETIWENF